MAHRPPMHDRRTGCGYTVLSVYCQWLVILQPIRARLHLRDINGSSFRDDFWPKHLACVASVERGRKIAFLAHRILFVRFCSQSERAKYICLKKSWISANQKGWLICLFPALKTNLVLSVLQDNKPIESLKNRCISRKTETGNQKPYISKYN